MFVRWFALKSKEDISNFVSGHDTTAKVALSEALFSTCSLCSVRLNEYSTIGPFLDLGS